MTSIQSKPQDAVFRILGVKLKWLAAAFMLASLLFAHGCHRHDDNELFTNWFLLGSQTAPSQHGEHDQ